MTKYVRTSIAVQDALDAAEAEYRQRPRSYTLLDAVDEHGAAGRLGPIDPALFDETVALDLSDWLDKPLKSPDKTMIVGRYVMLWKVQQRDRARRFLQVLSCLWRYAAFEHPELELGDPFTFRPERWCASNGTP